MNSPRAARDGEGTAVFNVGGRHFEVLRQTIEARPATLLASLLDDIGTDSGRPIFVDANPDRFGYVLDWYRFGEMHIPSDCPIGGILCDSRFFLLPNTVNINGSSHLLHPAVRPDAADHVRATATEHIIADWPSFEQYMTSLIAKVRGDLDSEIERAKSVQNDDIRSCQVGQDLRKQHSPPKTNFALSKDERKWYDSPYHCWVTEQVWSDVSNVCNRERLRVVVTELAKRGFECELKRDGSLSLVVSLCKAG